MPDRKIEVNLTGTIKHVGFEAEFNDPEKVTIPKRTIRRYSQAMDTSRIFVETRQDVAYSAADMLSYYLKASGKVLSQLVDPRSLSPFGGTTVSRIPIDFTPGSFHMVTTKGPVDMKRLVLLVQFQLGPQGPAH